MFMKTLLMFCAAISFSGFASYEVTRVQDGDFSFSISGVQLNEGSSLKRETILLNHPGSTVQLTGSSLGFEYKNRNFQINGETEFTLTKNIHAVEIRHALYDVFGKHIQNLSNREVKDMAPGPLKVDGTWRAQDSYVSRLLTNVTYVARVRFEDGTQWVADWEAVAIELGKLQLERLADPKDLDE